MVLRWCCPFAIMRWLGVVFHISKRFYSLLIWIAIITQFLRQNMKVLGYTYFSQVKDHRDGWVSQGPSLTLYSWTWSLWTLASMKLSVVSKIPGLYETWSLGTIPIEINIILWLSNTRFWHILIIKMDFRLPGRPIDIPDGGLKHTICIYITWYVRTVQIASRNQFHSNLQ